MSTSVHCYQSFSPKLNFTSEVDWESGIGNISVESEENEDNKLFFKVSWTKTTTTYSGRLQTNNTTTAIENPSDDTSFKPTLNQSLGPMSLEYSIDTQSGTVNILCKLNGFSFNSQLQP